VAYGLLKVFLSGAAVLPLSALRWIGRSLVRLVIPLLKRERRRIAEHLRLAFPDRDDADLAALEKRCKRHLGGLLGEIFWLMHADADQVRSLCEITGTEHLEKALEAGNGAVLVTAHAGNWELLNAMLGLSGVPMSIVVRDVYDPRIDALATGLRSRFGAEVIHRGSGAGKQLFAALKKNRVIGLLIDQDIPTIPGVFVPFFGIPAYTPSGAAGMALKGDCPVIPAFIHRLPDGRHRAEVHPPLEAPAGGTYQERVEALTAAATAAIEEQIRRYPEQWVWMHRRWRTKPSNGGEMESSVISPSAGSPAPSGNGPRSGG